MASGDLVVQVIREMPPAANFAPLVVRVGGSSPAENASVWQFDASTIQYIDFLCRLRGYGAGGLTFSVPWMGATAIVGVCRWGIAIRRLQDDVDSVDASHTYDFNDVDDTVASATGETSYPTVTFTNGADMDDWSDGELAIVRLRRNASHANDNMAGFAQAWDIEGRET